MNWKLWRNIPVALLALGCIKLKDDKSKPHFVLLGKEKLKNSILPQLAADKDIVLCTRVIGNDDSSRQRDLHRLNIAVTKALRTWLASLAKIPGWPATNEKNITFLCNGQQRLDIEFFQDIRSFKAKYPFESSFSDMANKRISLHPADIDYLIESDFVQKDANLALEFVVLHELGHQIGLGDTYDKLSYISPIGEHGVSVMHGGNGIENKKSVLMPSLDDQAALRALYDFLATGNLSCNDGFKELPGRKPFGTLVVCIEDNGSGTFGILANNQTGPVFRSGTLASRKPVSTAGDQQGKSAVQPRPQSPAVSPQLPADNPKGEGKPVLKKDIELLD